MALSDYGTSFSPTQKAGADRAKPSSGNQTQEAIRTISTRIPRITPGARTLAPEPLLTAPGGAGLAAPMGTLSQPNVGGLEELIRRLFGILSTPLPQAPSAAPPMSPVGAPAPTGLFAPPLSRQPSAPASAPLPHFGPGFAGPTHGSGTLDIPSPPSPPPGGTGSAWLPHMTPGLRAPSPHLPMPSGPPSPPAGPPDVPVSVPGPSDWAARAMWGGW